MTDADEKRSGAAWTSLSTKILFFSGLAGVAFEAAVKNNPRAHLLLLYGVMMGLAKLGDIIRILLTGINVNIGSSPPPQAPPSGKAPAKNGGSAP